MPVTLDTLDNGYTLYVTFSEPWVAHDMYPLFKQDKQHRDQILRQEPGRKVHLVVDLSRVHNSVNGLFQGRQSPSFSHRNAGHVMIIGANSLVAATSRAAMRIVRFERFHFVDTKEEALAFVRGLIEEEEQGVRKAV
jgi:hypothetical protein